ncbi:MAG: transposase [Candidatus Paceibacteria bacterium]
MIRKQSFVPGEWYHCYNRGTDKRVIFKSAPDYKRFLMLLYAANSTKRIILSNFGKGTSVGPSLEKIVDGAHRGERLVDIGAYALMPNHFHLLLKESVEGGITTFMRKVCTGYAMSFNLKYKRTGTLFESRFKAKHISDDRYMRRIVNYIHANPAELFEPDLKIGKIGNIKNLKSKLWKYPYSSYPDYQQGVERLEAIIVQQESLRNATDVDLNFNRVITDAVDFAREEKDTKLM